MHHVRFLLGLRTIPRWRSLQRSPNPTDGFKEPSSNLRGKGKEAMGGERTETELRGKS